MILGIQNNIANNLSDIMLFNADPKIFTLRRSHKVTLFIEKKSVTVKNCNKAYT